VTLATRGSSLVDAAKKLRVMLQAVLKPGMTISSSTARRDCLMCRIIGLSLRFSRERHSQF
jgi:hypothetical protein